MEANRKARRECWLLEQLKDALSGLIDKTIIVECGEKDFSDGELIINNEKIPIQIVTADGIIERNGAIAKKIGKSITYDVKSVEWIKYALKLKIDKNYSEPKKLTILIECSSLGSTNGEYLSRELTDKDTINMAREFKDVYILSPADDKNYIERHPPQIKPILFKIPVND